MDYNDIKYQHVARFGEEDCLGIENGKCYLQPKVDGTNSVLWWDGELKCGSRTREVNPNNDNQKFADYILSEPLRYEKLLDTFQNCVVYGEWTKKKHTVKYIPEAMGKFYVFDIRRRDGTYITPEEYEPVLKALEIDYIPVIAVLENPTYEQLVEVMNQNTFLVEDGTGEGIVIKRFDYINQWNRIVWAKIVAEEYKQEKHKVKKDYPPDMIEIQITEILTDAFIEKEYLKLAEDGWNAKKIPILLNTVFHEFINDEIWNILKKFRFPTINFKTLNYLVISRIKEVKKELF